jgi:hypothetical protein
VDTASAKLPKKLALITRQFANIWPVGPHCTTQELITGIRDVSFLQTTADDYIPTYTRTDVTDALYDAVGFRTDYEVLGDTQIKKNLKLVKIYKKVLTMLDRQKGWKPVINRLRSLLLFFKCQRSIPQNATNTAVIHLIGLCILHFAGSIKTHLHA